MTLPSDPRLMIPVLRTALPNLMAQQIVGVQPMTGTGGYSLFNQFFNKKFNKKYWPYQYYVKVDVFSEVERWCWERFKGRYWNNYGRQFVFKREKDYTMFVLRWS